MQLRVIKHTTFEGPGAVAAWAKERGYALETTELEQGQALPSPADFDALVLMGGPMSVNEEDVYAWLRPEKALVRETLAKGKKVLGICLGAQMIASAMGAKIAPNAFKEIGWFPLEATAGGQDHPFFKRMPKVMPAFHWHGETFGIPKGAVHLARTSVCEHQAFALGSQALGLQFHMEVDADSLREMVEGGREEIVAGAPFIQNQAVLLGQPELLGPLGIVCRAVLDDWIMA
jgi:GMP synthase-like glutamine amidotransferase